MDLEEVAAQVSPQLKYRGIIPVLLHSIVVRGSPSSHLCRWLCPSRHHISFSESTSSLMLPQSSPSRRHCLRNLQKEGRCCLCQRNHLCKACTAPRHVQRRSNSGFSLASIGLFIHADAQLCVQDAKAAGFNLFGGGRWTRLRDTQVSNEL